ncbi:prefoldin subunit beta [Candidatus Woesearchaeota archaeon]|nr:prefoldin subunit beta [Candidatus Woesearchaeota archaeon]
MNKETEKKIQQLQLIEQNLHNIIMQKQAFQMQLAEDENAMKELDKTSKNAYKIIGTIMVSSSREELKKELKEQKDILDLRIKSLEKQENNFKEKAEEIQKEVMKDIK